MEFQTKYKEDLEKLKAKLPSQHIKAISQKLTGIDEQQIKRAFAGTLKDVELYGKIVDAATEIVSERIRAFQERTEKVSQVLGNAQQLGL